MNKIFFIIFLILFPSAVLAQEADLKRVFVAEANVIGAVPNKIDTRQIVKALLQSKVLNDNIISVHGENEADYVIRTTYVVYGGLHNLDAVVLDSNGKSLKRFKSEFANELKLISAIEDIAKKVNAIIIQSPPFGRISSTNLTDNTILAKDRFITYANEDRVLSKNKKIIFEGQYNLMQPVTSGFVLASNRSLYYVAEPKNKTLLKQYKIGSKIIYLSSFKNGNELNILVTRYELGDVLSDIYTLKDGKLSVVSRDQPYFVRVVSVESDVQAKLYVQEQGNGENQFYGKVFSAVVSSGKLVKLNELALPRYGSIYNFNLLNTLSGDVITQVLDENGYVVVYNDNKTMWKSGEKYGGSELSYQVKDLNNLSVAGRDYRTFFVDKRVQVLPNSAIIIAKNVSNALMGDARIYKNGKIYMLRWTGSEFEEVWKTNDTNYYVSDYYYDNAKSELTLLLHIQREELIGDGQPKTELRTLSVAR